MDWSIGKSIYRKDADDKVTGAAKYTDDLSNAQMLHIKLVISIQAHALLKKY